MSQKGVGMRLVSQAAVGVPVRKSTAHFEPSPAVSSRFLDPGQGSQSRILEPQLLPWPLLEAPHFGLPPAPLSEDISILNLHPQSPRLTTLRATRMATPSLGAEGGGGRLGAGGGRLGGSRELQPHHE